MKDVIKLTVQELASRHTRQKWAEGLILQLPKKHDGRNSWLLNYGTGEEAQQLRENHSVPLAFSNKYQAACSQEFKEQESLEEILIEVKDIRDEFVTNSDSRINDLCNVLIKLIGKELS